MRFPYISTAALALALAALTVAAFSTGYLMPLAFGTAAATCFVAFATLLLYRRAPRPRREILVENFSLWSDIGEPAAGLRSATDFFEALRIIKADLGSIASNSELLSARTEMLVGRPGFEWIVREGLNVYTRNLEREVGQMVEKVSEATSAERLRDTLPKIESCASQADRIASKFYEFGREGREKVRIYTEPLHRAAEKLSRDLRSAHANISDYLKPPEVPPPEVITPAEPEVPPPGVGGA